MGATTLYLSNFTQLFQQQTKRLAYPFRCPSHRFHSRVLILSPPLN